MKQYETTVIIDGQLDEQHREGVIAKFEGILDRLGATRSRTVRWGSRTLAYPIKKCTRGYYVILYFEAEAPVLRPFHHEMDIFESILRYLTIQEPGPHPDYIRDEGTPGDVTPIEPEEPSVIEEGIEEVFGEEEEEVEEEEKEEETGEEEEIEESAEPDEPVASDEEETETEKKDDEA